MVSKPPFRPNFYFKSKGLEQRTGFRRFRKLIKKDGDIPFEMKITSVEKNGKVIVTTLETKGEFGWIAMAEKMGGVEKYKAMMQRRWAGEALMTSGLQLARCYTLRYRFVDNGKKVCTVDVSKMIIRSMIDDYRGLDDLPEYVPEPLPQERFNKFY